MRIIDADVAKGFFLKDAGKHPTEVLWEYWAIETELDSIPELDAKIEQHGHWITHNANNPFEICGECSQCGFEQSLSHTLNYCPDCGAKMDEYE